MIGFKVSVNDEKIGICGFEDWSVLNSILSVVRDRYTTEDLNFFVRGLSRKNDEGFSEHVRFVERNVTIGDRISIEIVETEQAIQTVKRYRSDSEVEESPFTDEEIEDMERREYEYLKAKFEVSP
ncbi:MAG: hypothetical protein AAF583_11820 [Pseudomonadota bacterium]